MFAANYCRVRDFLPIAYVTGDHSAGPRKSCAAGGWPDCSARVGAKQRLHRGDVVLAALAQRWLMDWMQKLSAGWRLITALG